MDTYAVFDNGTAELVIIRLLNVEVKEALDIYFQGFRSPTVKESARRGIECAYESIFSRDIKAYTQKMPISVMVKDFAQQVGGSSAGLAYAVAFATALKKENIIDTSLDLPHFIAATGEVDIIGNVKKIKCIKEKILGAISKNVSLIFYPSQNKEELGLLMEQDEEFSYAVKMSGIRLKDVSSIKQLFYELGILPGGFMQDEHACEECLRCNKLSAVTGKSRNGCEGADDIKLEDPERKENVIKNWVSRQKHKILKILLPVLALIIIGVLICVMLATRAHVSVNLALHKIAYASSDESLACSSANAFDGDTSTRWSSKFSDEQWIYVDLGESNAVSSVVLNWEVAYAKQYQIQVSDDGISWAIVYTGDSIGGVDVINFDTVNARYVKMYGCKRGTGYGYSLWEFKVYSNKQALPAKN